MDRPLEGVALRWPPARTCTSRPTGAATGSRIARLRHSRPRVSRVGCVASGPSRACHAGGRGFEPVDPANTPSNSLSTRGVVGCSTLGRGPGPHWTGGRALESRLRKAPGVCAHDDRERCRTAGARPCRQFSGRDPAGTPAPHRRRSAAAGPLRDSCQRCQTPGAGLVGPFDRAEPSHDQNRQPTPATMWCVRNRASTRRSAASDTGEVVVSLYSARATRRAVSAICTPPANCRAAPPAS